MLICLFLLHNFISDTDQRLTKPLQTIQPGTFISYSYRRLIDHPITPLLAYRLFANRFAHMALVVSYRNEPHVIEWRMSPLPALSSYVIKKPTLGYIYRIPALEYLQLLHEHDAIFCLYQPPKPMDISFQKEIVDKIVKENPLIICSFFAAKYVQETTNQIQVSGIPILFTPGVCQETLRNAEWKEEYCFYDKRDDYTMANGSLSRSFPPSRKQIL